MISLLLLPLAPNFNVDGTSATAQAGRDKTNIAGVNFEIGGVGCGSGKHDGSKSKSKQEILSTTYSA